MIKKYFQILTGIIIVFLIVSTFVIQRETSGIIHLLQLDHFYNSGLNFALWTLMCGVIFYYLVSKKVKRWHQIILHGTIALIILLVTLDKIKNERVSVSIREGQTILLNDSLHAKKLEPTSLTLKKFTIKTHPGSRMPSAFISNLNINGKPERLEVNKPIKIGKYRLYQNAYDKEACFTIEIDGITHFLPFDDMMNVNNKLIRIDTYDHMNNRMVLNINGNTHTMKFNELMTINGMEIKLLAPQTKYISVIEVVEVRGLSILLIISIVYLLGLAYVFWMRR